jgi:hypothetical protein
MTDKLKELTDALLGIHTPRQSREGITMEPTKYQYINKKFIKIMI